MVRIDKIGHRHYAATRRLHLQQPQHAFACRNINALT
jgi:hypothetical protein